MRSVHVIVIAAALLATVMVPTAAGQYPISSQVRMYGDTPQTVQPDDDVLDQRELKIEYRYNGPLTTEDRTTVDLSVQKAPEWLDIQMPDRVHVPVESTGQSEVVNFTAAFGVRSGYFPLAFKQEVVTIHMQAEDNGGVNGSSNTLSWVLEAGYRGLYTIEVGETPIRLTPGEVRYIDLTVENLGNAPVEPGFRFVDVPEGLTAGMASDGGVLGTPVRHERPTTTDATMVLKDQGGDWSHRTVRLRVGMSPIWGSASSAETVDVFVIRSVSPLGVLGIVAVIGALGSGVAGYLKRRGDGAGGLWPDG